MKKLLYSSIVLKINSLILSIFYDSKYLKGKFFYEKRMGWFWAWKGLFNRILGINRNIPWPTSSKCIISNSQNIIFHEDSINIFQSFGCYFQNHKGIIDIGKNVHIAPNVGIITTNHDIYDLENHIDGKDVVISDNCWVGMNSVILPGVILGPHTIVGAGSVVTHSFADGFVVIGGNPARVLYHLDKSKIKESE